VKHASSIHTFAALERRETALMRAACGASHRADAAAGREAHDLYAVRSSFAYASVWTAQACRLMDLRSARSACICSRLRVAARSAREIAAHHDAQRRRWATLLRGLHRRESRRASQGVPCPD
jgi:hypothetical protein